ncbi:MAG: hypothetical protein U0175_39595 [Caldilineaceae bacterium]
MIDIPVRRSGTGSTTDENTSRRTRDFGVSGSTELAERLSRTIACNGGVW